MDRFCSNCGAVMKEDVIFCNNCGAKFEQEAVFCGNCGVKLDSDSKFCGNCGAEVVQRSKFCVKCGNKLLSGANFCDKCGTQQPSFQQNQRAYARAGSPRRNVGISRYVNFEEAIRLLIKNAFNFTGRASRSEFWWAVLALVIVEVIIGICVSVAIARSYYSIAYFGTGLFALGAIGVILIIIYIFLAIPSLALGIRRLHDIGKAWEWILFGLIPFVGWIILIVFFVRESDVDNEWGPVYREIE